MRYLHYFYILVFCVCCQAELGKNTFKHPSLGLSITKPTDWEYLNPNEIRARISASKLEDEDAEAIVKTFMAPPVLEILKPGEKAISPKLSITVSPLEMLENNSPIYLLKKVSRRGPDVFKNYKTIVPPVETIIAGKKAAYMKAHYVNEYIGDNKGYPSVYETWIIPRNGYYFMVGATSLQSLNNEVQKEFDSIVKSIKFEDENRVFNENLISLIESHLNEAIEKKYSFEDCLQFAKPYGLWDVRPRGINYLIFGNQLAEANNVSWIHAGLLTRINKLRREENFLIYEKWTRNISGANTKLKNIGDQQKTKLISLAETVKKSDKDIFISHDKFKRVDSLFCHEGEFFKYDLPENSFFSISDKKLYPSDTGKVSYDEKDKDILSQLENLDYYGIVKHNNTIIIIIDGMLCSSYGYIFAPSELDIIGLGPLYNIQGLHKVSSDPDFYLYFSR